MEYANAMSEKEGTIQDILKFNLIEYHAFVRVYS